MRAVARPLLAGVMLAVLPLGASVHAQPGDPSDVPSPLSLQDALRLASARNPRIAAARTGVDVAQADRLGARARPNPAVTIASEGYLLFESRRPSFIDGQELTLRLDQEIELGGRRRLRIESAELGISQAEAARRNVERQVLFEVRRAYAQASLAQADLDAARGALGEIDRTLVLNRARLQQGEISGADVRRVEAERLRFVEDVFAGELALRNATAGLLMLLNAPDLSQAIDIADPLRPTDITLPTTAGALTIVEQSATPSATSSVVPSTARSDVAAAAPVDASSLRQQALANRPDLIAALHAERRAETETRLQRALRTPNVTVGGGYIRDLTANAIVVGVTVPLPLFNRNQGPIARADAQRRAAQLERMATEAAVTLDVQQARNAVEISRARVAYIERDSLGNAQQSLEIVRASYQLGAADLIDLLDAQRTYRETRRTYNRALYELRVSHYQLDAALGRDTATR